MIFAQLFKNNLFSYSYVTITIKEEKKSNNTMMKIEIRRRLTDCLHIAHNTCQDLKSKQQTS